VWAYVLGITLAATGLLVYMNASYAPAALFIPLAYYAVRTYMEGSRRRAVDEEVTRALLELSSARIRTYDDVISALSHGYGRLSEEVRRARDAKLPPERKLRALEDTGGRITKRAIRTIMVGMAGGADTQELFRRVAEDLEAQINVERSKQSSLALQRYATMLTVGVFVPAVLGLTARLVGDLTSTRLFPRDPAVDVMISLMPAHIAVVGAETALYLALLDGKVKHVALYAVLLIPLAMSIFWALCTG